MSDICRPSPPLSPPPPDHLPSIVSLVVADLVLCKYCIFHRDRRRETEKRVARERERERDGREGGAFNGHFVTGHSRVVSVVLKRAGAVGRLSSVVGRCQRMSMVREWSFVCVCEGRDAAAGETDDLTA